MAGKSWKLDWRKEEERVCAYGEGGGAEGGAGGARHVGGLAHGDHRGWGRERKEKKDE